MFSCLQFVDFSRILSNNFSTRIYYYIEIYISHRLCVSHQFIECSDTIQCLTMATHVACAAAIQFETQPRGKLKKNESMND